MSIQLIVSIFGGFLLVALGVNGWYLKEIHERLNHLQEEIVKAIMHNTFLESKVDKLEEKQETQEKINQRFELELERLKK